MDTPTPMPIQYSDICAGNSGTSRLMNRVTRAAAATPHTPPSVVRVTASTTNWNRMFRGRAPTALRTPISRVRSLTDTSMMFITPMPPTIRPMEAITMVITNRTKVS